MPERVSQERIYGLDLIRTFAFLAILVFHSSWALWLDPSGPPDPLPTAVWKIAEWYARSFSFSGFTILFLSSLLIGFKGVHYKKSFWLPFFLLTAWLIFSFCTYLKEKTFSLEWDIYPLLALGLLSGNVLMRQRQNLQLVLTLICIALLSFPVWNFPFLESIPFFLGQILFGQCPEDYADWPIFPWIGLIWLGMLAGFQIRKSLEQGEDFHFRRWELPLACLIILFWWHFRSAYFQTKLGDHWSCFTFRQEPRIFWSHMLFWIACIRMSWHPRVQEFLRHIKFIRVVSHLRINRNFFLAYLMHYVILFTLIGILDPDQTADRLWVLDFILLATLPLTEVTTHSLLSLISKTSGYLPGE